ncbi:hypothetical protein STEG23_032090 [Scotinomys teguina]
MPSQLQDLIPQVFNIIVIPVNDPPYLKLPEGHLLLFENSKKQLTPNMVQVSDPDTDSRHLRLSVLSNLNTDTGFLESASDPGRAINGFTHVDLQEGNIFYVHKGHRNSRIVLRATDGELVSNTVVLRIMAVPWDFEVAEGEWTLISKSELFVQTLDSHVFQYKVTKSPQHGELKLANSSSSLGSSNNITGFTDADIVGGRLIYVHDDSETQCDEFIVLASATELGQQGGVRSLDSKHMLTEIKVSISIELKNDEKPVRVVDKVFHVVRGSQRLLTLADLCYHDPDLDFDDGQLLYTRRGIPNGDLVKASDPTQKLYQFRQEDLQEGRVLFRHHGPDSARFLLFVTDGVHYTSSLLEVSVSEAYVHVVNNTGLLVHRGRDSRLTTANLSVTTNQDVRTDHEFEFHILQPPTHGRILVNNSVSHAFSQHDLKQGHVIYRHNGDGKLDVFNLTVKVKDAYLDVSICVQVSLKSHQHDTQILHTRSLIVEEGKPVKLSNGRFQTGNNDHITPETVFIVRTPPQHGHLQKSTAEDGSVGTDGKSPLSFTQQDIDDGNVLYVQTAPGQQEDQFTLAVTKDSHFVRRVDVHLDIIPKWIPLEVQNFTVEEGGSRAPLQDHLRIPSKFFQSLDCEFVLLEPPKHGYIESSSFPTVKLMKFSRKQSSDF